jgi:uncharacterized protein
MKYNKEIEFFGKFLVINIKGKKILVVGDLHLGYEESLNIAGVFVGRNMYQGIIEDFDRLFDKIKLIDEVVFLGDVKHGFEKALRQERGDLVNLIDYLINKGSKKIILVKGNHDTVLGSFEGYGDKVEFRDYYVLGKFGFMHGDKDYVELNDREIKFWVMGHAHPAITIKDKVKSEKYKCFLVGKYNKVEVIIVPSFFGVNVGTDPRYFDYGLYWNFNYNEFDVFAISDDDKIYNFGKLGKII